VSLKSVGSGILSQMAHRPRVNGEGGGGPPRRRDWLYETMRPSLRPPRRPGRGPWPLPPSSTTARATATRWRRIIAIVIVIIFIVVINSSRGWRRPCRCGGPRNAAPRRLSLAPLSYAAAHHPSLAWVLLLFILSLP